MREGPLSGCAFPPSSPGGLLFFDGLARSKERLLARALNRFIAIEPCSGRSWEESFTTERGALMLWYNTPDGNTHVEREAV